MSVAAASAAPKVVRMQSGVVTTFRPTDSLAEEAVLGELRELIEQALGSGENRIIIDLPHHFMRPPEPRPTVTPSAPDLSTGSISG